MWSVKALRGTITALLLLCNNLLDLFILFNPSKPVSPIVITFEYLFWVNLCVPTTLFYVNVVPVSTGICPVII